MSDRNIPSKTESFMVGALRTRFADESMPWTRPHVESLINQIAELTKQRDEGWNNFYALRKQVAEERYPGLTGAVRAHETTSARYQHKADCPAARDMPVGLWVCTCNAEKTKSPHSDDDNV